MMNKLFSVFLYVTLLASCANIEKYNSQITALHAVEDLHRDINKAYKQLQKHHPKLYQYTSKTNLDFKFDSLKKSIHQPLNSRTFYKKLAPVITHVKQGHVALSSVHKRFTKRERKELSKKKFEFYDLNFEYLENKLWVRNSYGKDSTLVGNQVLSLNGENASKLAEIYKTRFASDGHNKTLHNRFVGKAFKPYYIRDKGFLDSLRVTFKSKDSVFSRWFKRIPKKEKKHSRLSDTVPARKIKIKKLTSKERKERRLASRKKRKDNKKYGYIPKINNYTRSFKFLGKDSTVAYMKIRSFLNGNYKKFYKESFTKINSAKTTNFILDLRDNGGGRIAEIENLYSFLTDKNYQFILESEVNSRIPFLKFLMSNSTSTGLKIASGLLSPIIIAGNLIRTKKKKDKLYYRFKQSKIRAPNALNYKGKMYVLINGNSFSASSLISTHLKAEKRAIFVGEETGGAYNGTVAGLFKTYRLPVTKLKLRMGLMQVEAPQKQSPDGYGIMPDIKIIPTVKDRKAELDTELEWILKDIESDKVLL